MAQDQEPEPLRDERGTRLEPFPIVGIGASAGGLSAFEAFFSAMPKPTETGMAFVLVQHLAPDHKSILADLVRRFTTMQVVEVEDGMRVDPNCAYIIPPNRDMALLDGALHLFEPGEPHGHRLPIDFFFRSLAQDRRERAICVVLSGTGSDGSLGIRAIKGEGGTVMVQAPETTEYDGMPRSAIATGLVDFVLSPEAMPAELQAYASRAFDERKALSMAAGLGMDESLKKICIVLRDLTGHDFSQYKHRTLTRRVERRMAIHQIDRIEDYLRYIRQTGDEAQALFRDLLIGVTSFFRDPAAFAALEREAIPRIFSDKASGAVVRAWICGCSTGEEAYSIAMLLHEQAERSMRDIQIQLFATDVDKAAIDQARAGAYPESIAADVSPARLERYFLHESGQAGYRIKKSIRDTIVFSEQDLIKDPPFSKLDLISCRNLLIYMSGNLQKKLIPMFHYALNERGFLFLGSSETIGEQVEYFDSFDRAARLFERRPGSAGAARPVFGAMLSGLSEAGSRMVPASAPGRSALKPDLRAVAEQALIEHYGAAALLVQSKGEILYILGRTGKYLEPSPGDAGMNVLDMAREGLRSQLRAAFRTVVARNAPVRQEGLRVRGEGGQGLMNLIVTPVGERGALPSSRDIYLVIFEDAAASGEGDAGGEGAAPELAALSDPRVEQLENELRVKEEYLQATVEEMETSNEELKSTIEELQSVNEELQSTNEELETSKEELQSVNEELATVNAELQNKVSELSKAKSDMDYLLAGTGVATLFVDFQLRISRFTPTISRIINLIESDVGRPVGHIVSNLVGYDRLIEDLREVLASLIPREVEVQTGDGSWYLMRIGPYRIQEDKLEGAVITFVDVTARKRGDLSLRDSLRYSENIIATLREPFLVLDSKLRVVSANPAYYRRFGLGASETEGKPLSEICGGRWDLPELKALLGQGLKADESYEDIEVVREIEGEGRVAMVFNARRMRKGPQGEERILLAMEDVVPAPRPR